MRSVHALAAKAVWISFKPGQTLSPPPTDLLPASSQDERLTYKIFERSVL